MSGRARVSQSFSAFFILFAALASAFLALPTWPFRPVLKLVFVGSAGESAKPSAWSSSFWTARTRADRDVDECGVASELLPTASGRGVCPAGHHRAGGNRPWPGLRFQTGCNPGKHRIYDFPCSNRKSLAAELSSANVTPPGARQNRKYRISLAGPPSRRAARASPSGRFSRFGVFSSVLRVPITFPPERLRESCFPAMNVPDVKGSQGTYFFFTTDQRQKSVSQRPAVSARTGQGAARGENCRVLRIRSSKAAELRIPFSIVTATDGSRIAQASVAGPDDRTSADEYHTVGFPGHRAALGFTRQSHCPFSPSGTATNVRLYVTPIQIDPGHPALPDFKPPQLLDLPGQAQGPFRNPRVAEDTSALNESSSARTPSSVSLKTSTRNAKRCSSNALKEDPAGASCASLTSPTGSSTFRPIPQRRTLGASVAGCAVRGTCCEICMFDGRPGWPSDEGDRRRKQC